MSGSWPPSDEPVSAASSTPATTHPEVGHDDPAPATETGDPATETDDPATETDEPPGGPEEASAPAEPDGRDGTRRPPPVVAWVVASIAVVAAAAALGLYFLGTPPEEQDRREVAQVASDTLMTLTNWDAGELDRVRADLAEIGTEQLQTEATQILDELAEALAAAGAESRGDVLELIAEVDRDEGVAVGIVRQELHSAELGAETAACWGVRVVTVRVDGRWMAERLDIVGPGECPAG